MIHDKAERRPLTTDGATSDTANSSSTSIVSQATAESMRVALDGAYCVLVVTPADTVRRRVFLSLHAAEKHAQRAEKRGCVARLMLCRLEPVTEVRA